MSTYFTIKESIANRNLRERDGYDVSLPVIWQHATLHDVSRQGCLQSEKRSVIKSVNIDDYRLRRT